MITNKRDNVLISGPYELLVSKKSVRSKDTVIRTHTGRLIVSSDGGIDYSDDDGTSWTHVGSVSAVHGLEEVCNIIFAYYVNMGGPSAKYSTDDGSTWQTRSALRNLYKAIGFNDKVLFACNPYDTGRNTVEMQYPGFKLYDVSSDTYQNISFPETYVGDIADVVKINDSEVVTYVTQNGNKVYRLNITTKTWTLVADLSSVSNSEGASKIKLFKDCGVIITKDNNSSNKYLVSRIDYGPTSASNIIDITYINKFITLDSCELCLANNSLFICHRDDVFKLGGFTTWSSDKSPIVPETILDKRYRPLYIAKYNLLMFLGYCYANSYASDYTNSIGRDIKYSLDDGNTFNTIDLQLTDAQAKANVPLVYIDPDKLFWCYDVYVNVFNISFETVKTCTKYLDQNGAQELVTQFKAYCDAKVGA